MAELIPKDRRGQIMMLAAIAAVVVGYVLWKGFMPLGVEGMTQFAVTRDSLQSQIDTLEAQVRRAKADVQHGTVQILEQRLAEYRTNLDLMRQLVPVSTEVPNLLDDISSRAKMRGATVAVFNPQAVESGAPFDTQRARFTVTGQYDQVGEFLTDIATLPRIVVPYDVKIEHASGPAADSTQRRTILQATFMIKTFVKAAPGSVPAAPAAPAARPAQPTSPAPQPAAAPRAGGGHA